MHELHIPRTESSSPDTASSFIKRINAQMIRMEHHKKPEEVIRIFYGGAFGVLRAIQITTGSDGFLRIVARSEDGQNHSIIAPVSQCSFMLTAVVPTSAEPEEKVILGFAEPEQT